MVTAVTRRHYGLSALSRWRGPPEAPRRPSPATRPAPSVQRSGPTGADPSTAPVPSALLLAIGPTTGPYETDVGHGRRADEFDASVVVGQGTEIVQGSLAPAQQDRHDHEVQLVDQRRAEVLPDGGGTPADEDVLVTGRLGGGTEGGLDPSVDEVEGRSPLEFEVVPPSIWSGSRGWWVSTKTGWWKGGSSPHQPVHSLSPQGPRTGPNMFRPMMVAPTPEARFEKYPSSSPSSPPSWPIILLPLRVAKIQSWSRVPPMPIGWSSSWWGPAA